MKKSWACLAVCVGSMVMVVVLAGWVFCGEIRFSVQLRSIVIDPSGRPRFVGIFPHGIGINTFEDEVESETIRRSYYRACQHLDAIRGSLPRKTYYWEDEITYPGVSSVVQCDSSYIEVLAYQGNDSDGVSVRIHSGRFLATKRAQLRELSTDLLPPGTLRCQRY